MIKNYTKTAFRSLTKNKAFAAIQNVPKKCNLACPFNCVFVDDSISH